MSYPPPSVEPDELANIEQLLEHFEQLETQFQTVRESLTRSHRLTTLGTLASIVAHELNNILTPMMSYAELAQMKPDDIQLAQKALQKTIQGCAKASRISECMLGFTREGKDQPVADLRKTLDDTFGCMARDPAKDGITVEIQVPDVQVRMSPLNLQQVLLNLLLNARKVMRRTGGSLSIRGEETGDLLQLKIADTGPGIPQAIRDSLFEPFVTVNADPQDVDTQSRGTGLGLCICRDLIQNAGGQIDFTTETGKGTTFCLELPIVINVCEST